MFGSTGRGDGRHLPTQTAVVGEFPCESIQLLGHGYRRSNVMRSAMGRRRAAGVNTGFRWT